MPNIKFSYLYRDGGNYKKFNSVIFSNPYNIKLSEVERLIQFNLIDGLWFYADKWRVPDIHFDTWNNEADHTFHEFEEVIYTNEAANAVYTAHEWMALIGN
ncbi:MAG: hypothetical protein AAGC65_24855 [Mucilaginibacter sp.]|uniref:hypothetical protein n=1 Tax=Mucilaginibacter sp. TaxID=1882438 RepID=UPI0031A0BA33